MTEANDFPFVHTTATRLLADGIRHTLDRDRISLRTLGKELGYKQAVVLSHMASGRVPIPIDRSIAFAERLGIDSTGFLGAVLEQRHPEIDWSRMGFSGQVDAGRFSLMADLTGGREHDELTPGQRKVMREVAADNRAERRWLSPHEVSAIELLREWRPEMVEHGLSPADREVLRVSLAGLE